MIFRDRLGVECEGSVWSAGPLASTVWVHASPDWFVVDIRTRRALDYTMPILLPPQSRERLLWAYEVIRSRRANPLPDDWTSCDPEYDIAKAIWNLSIEQDKLTGAVRATRYAARASVSARRLLELMEE